MDYSAILEYKYPDAEYAFDDGAGITFWQDAAPKPTLSQLRGHANAQAYKDYRKRISDQAAFRRDITVDNILDALLEKENGDSTKLNAILIEYRKTL